MTTRVRKAVIPAAGLGTRFLPASKAQPKEMLPVIDKPAIQYVVEEAVEAGIRDILVITGRGKGSIEDHFDHAYELEHVLEAGGKTSELETVEALADLADVHFIRQGRPLGLGHAVSVARQHVGDEPFAVMLGDDIMTDATVLSAMIDAQSDRGGSVVALKRFPPEEISSYGCAAVDEADGALVRIRELVEKPAPADAPSDLAVMGRYVLGPEIFDALEQVKPGKGGEIQLTDAIAMLLADGDVHGYVFEHGRYDIGKKLDYLRATGELALERDDLGADFRAYLTGLARREKLV